MRVWLDDLRPMPANFDLHVKTANEAIEILKTGNVTAISLDHDLGSEDMEHTGYTVALFIEEAAFNGTLSEIQLMVHSQNNVGRQNILSAFQQAQRFWTTVHPNR